MSGKWDEWLEYEDEYDPEPKQYSKPKPKKQPKYEIIFKEENV